MTVRTVTKVISGTTLTALMETVIHLTLVKQEHFKLAWPDRLMVRQLLCDNGMIYQYILISALETKPLIQIIILNKIKHLIEK